MNPKGKIDEKTMITQKELVRRQSVFAIQSNLDRIASVVIEEPAPRDVIQLESVSSVSDSSEGDSPDHDPSPVKDKRVQAVVKSKIITPKASEIRPNSIIEELNVESELPMYM